MLILLIILNYIIINSKLLIRFALAIDEKWQILMTIRKDGMEFAPRPIKNMITSKPVDGHTHKLIRQTIEPAILH